MSYISDKRWSEAVREIEPFTLEGHDRDCAKAMLSQSILTGRVSPLSEVQVKHLLWIGYSAGREAAVADLRDRGLLVEPGSETRVELEVMSRGYEWGERHADGSVSHTALSGLVDDGWRPLRRDPAATLVRRTKTVYATEYGPWQPVDASGDTP